MSTKHTPGPWIITHERKQDRSVVTGVMPLEGDTNRWICRISDNPDIEFTEEQANAALIAAAPELLAALKIANVLVRNLVDEKNISSEGISAEDYQKYTRWVGQIQDAVSKAAGRS